MGLLVVMGMLWSVHGWAQELNPEWAKEVGQCAGTGQSQIWLFKQWHLSPGTQSRDELQAKSLPQMANQRAIFLQLNRWIQAGQVKTVIGEGCEGELNTGVALRFNGWSINDLSLRALQTQYEDVVSHVPMKLEALHDKSVDTWCGDSEKLMREHSLAFSDARGMAGFIGRIQEFQNDPEKVQSYVESVTKLFQLKKNQTVESVLQELKRRLRQKVDRIEQLFSERNEAFLKVIKARSSKPLAVVIGGMHVADLQAKLEKNKLSCTVVEPVGYASGDEKLISQLRTLLEK